MQGDFFPLIFVVKSDQTPGDKIHKSVGALLWLFYSGVFNSQTCLHWASRNMLQFIFFYPGTGSHTDFCSWISALVNCDYLYSSLCLSNFRVSGLPCDLISLKDIRRVVDFSVCLVFCILLWCTVLSSLHIRLKALSPYLFLINI